ncbi:hypothetical protein JTE90_010219 [Oedothorax gibbosus]|uniref:Uncharacterized protein n=1 Tax=Oedothorax gibbosus TaxID=931172 RepID=A0AAV6UKL8_9ARAC|nr:hypothetical protein JTE90_010219 [Oedothorax gibbosus]
MDSCARPLVAKCASSLLTAVQAGVTRKGRHRGALRRRGSTPIHPCYPQRTYKVKNNYYFNQSLISDKMNETSCLKSKRDKSFPTSYK